MPRKEKYEDIKASGRCVCCGGERDSERLLCSVCSERQSVRQKRRRADKDTEEKIRLLNIIREMVGYDK